MIPIIIALFFLFLCNSSTIIAQDQSEIISKDSSTLFDPPVFLGFENNSDFSLNQAYFFADNNFQILPLNNYGNLNFNQIKFDGISLNLLYDKSLDYSLISFDENLNFNGNEYFKRNISKNKNVNFQFVGGSIFGSANITAQASINDLKIRTRNNYYVSNGYNNPKGTLFNPISDINKQSFQSWLNLSLSDSKTTIEYNQFILSNVSKNKFLDSDNEFKDLSNFNSIFVLKYNSQNSDVVSTNAMIFLKYSNRLINLTDQNQFQKDNELSYGVSVGTLIKLIDEPTQFSFKYFRNNLDLTQIEKYYQYQAEDIVINLNQKLSFYENNITSLGASLNIINTIDKLRKSQYDKSLDYGFTFDFSHFSKIAHFVNELYLNVKYENEMPSFKYLFATNIADEATIPNIDYQNRITIGNKTSIDFLNIKMDFNVSYVRFNEYYNIDTIWLASKLNESWMMHLDFSLSYWILNLESNYTINIFGKNFVSQDRINTLPSMFVKMNLRAKISENSVLNLMLYSYNFNYNNLINLESMVFEQLANLFNIKLEQKISNNIGIFLSMNNILDEQIPLYPNFYKPGFNYMGGISIKL